MKLVMFDIDGTLTDTHDADIDGFVNAVREVLGIFTIDTNWTSYPHATSEGVLDEIVRRATGRPVTVDESLAVRRRFLVHLERIALREIPGAGAFLRKVSEAGYAVALASGDWECSARFKLARAGIPAEPLPAAFCDSAIARVNIMKVSLERARCHYGCVAFDSVLYVGDGSWDVQATRQLGWRFLGVGTHAARLQTLGVRHVVPDYVAGDSLLATLDECVPPA
ncbi:MAG: haloacid dehalogenase-like hydrolase [Opitutaceae bacterium]|nr:haloacid dehalogenase-like hydrolase [Opitutaceae bacterium]